MSDRMIDEGEEQRPRRPRIKNKSSFVSGGSSDRSERNFYVNLTNLIAEDSARPMPYRSKF